jgi:hypothetical protein
MFCLRNLYSVSPTPELSLEVTASPELCSPTVLRQMPVSTQVTLGIVSVTYCLPKPRWLDKHTQALGLSSPAHTSLASGLPRQVSRPEEAMSPGNLWADNSLVHPDPTESEWVDQSSVSTGPQVILTNAQVWEPLVYRWGGKAAISPGNGEKGLSSLTFNVGTKSTVGCSRNKRNLLRLSLLK